MTTFMKYTLDILNFMMTNLPFFPNTALMPLTYFM